MAIDGTSKQSEIEKGNQTQMTIFRMGCLYSKLSINAISLSMSISNDD